ncbi:TonB-dependent receptor [Chryseobacterium sp. KACC 21268]|nr:TonB-dependent receptor [Chryseobacterium sp. KACC 21268]
MFFVLLLTSVFSFAQAVTEQFLVKGNCNMCKARIETTATKAGAISANWSAETQTLTMVLDESKVTCDTILKQVAEAGHDNEKFKASEDAYKALPACCLYTRGADKNENVHTDLDSNAKQIEGVKITREKEATAISKKEAGLIFNISSKELLKAACCNLSESFETNATVDVSFSNAVTGTKQLKMLGLDQKYTLLTKEQLPEIRGLASAYGLNFIPGKWIGGIQLTKGGSTVVNGYESITGQINTELLKSHDDDKKSETEINLFSDNNGRVEANVTSTSPISDKWNQSVLLHGNGTFGDTDMNDDNFLDRPKGSQLNVAYLLNYNDLESSGFASHFGINFLKDERTAGQIGFNKRIPQKDQSLYGVGIDISRFQLWNKTGYIFKGKPYQSLGWMNQMTYHQQDSFFGLRNYYGKETSYYSNLIFESIIGNTNNKYKVGASFLYDKYDEDYLLDNYKRTETVPGLFAEYTLTGEKFTLVTGARVDFHNLAGTQFTPRMNFKYDLTPKTIFRISAGRGFRTANIFAESQSYFASNREIQVINNGGEIYGLKPEIAWNYGVSLQQEFKLFGRKSTLLADFFRTDFQNQVVTDLDESAQKILFYNLEGKSFANSFQTQWDFQPVKNLEFRVAYKYYDVALDYLSGLKKVPFMAKHRGFANLAYSTNKTEKGRFWSFDTTLNLVGKQRLPNTKSNPAEFQIGDYSPSYSTLNAQISRNFSEKIRVYLGGENLTGYQQKVAILDAGNPFGNYFDGGMVYAPIMKQNFYVGVDFKF